MLEIRLKLLLNYCGVTDCSENCRKSNKMNRKVFKMFAITLLFLIIEITDTAKAFPFVKEGETKEITDNRLLTDFSDSTVSLLEYPFYY